MLMVVSVAPSVMHMDLAADFADRFRLFPSDRFWLCVIEI